MAGRFGCLADSRTQTGLYRRVGNLLSLGRFVLDRPGSISERGEGFRMPINNRSRQPQRLDRLMRVPNGPHMKRTDTLVSNNSWDMFVSLRDPANMTQRQALEYALQLAVW